MARTITLESLTPDVQRALEEMLTSEEPVFLSRAGLPIGRVEVYDVERTEFAEMTPEEEADIRAAVEQGEAEYAAGNYITLDDFEKKYAAKLGADAE